MKARSLDYPWLLARDGPSPHPNLRRPRYHFGPISVQGVQKVRARGRWGRGKPSGRWFESVARSSRSCFPARLPATPRSACGSRRDAAGPAREVDAACREFIGMPWGCTRCTLPVGGERFWASGWLTPISAGLKIGVPPAEVSSDGAKNRRPRTIGWGLHSLLTAYLQTWTDGAQAALDREGESLEYAASNQYPRIGLQVGDSSTSASRRTATST